MVIGFAGDGAFGISMNEMSSCARKEWPAITMVIFMGPKLQEALTSLSYFQVNI